MAALATTSVTNNSPASAASGSTGTPANGDAFAAILDQLAQELSGASVSADAAPATDADTQTDATPHDPTSGDANAISTTPALDPLLTQLLAQQAGLSTPAPAADLPKPGSNDADKANPETSGVADTMADAAPTPAPATLPADPSAISNGTNVPAARTDCGTGTDTPDVPLKADLNAPDRAAADTPVKALADTPAKADAPPRETVDRAPGRQPSDRVPSKSQHRTAASTGSQSDPLQVRDTPPATTAGQTEPAAVPAVSSAPAEPASAAAFAPSGDRAEAIAAAQPVDPVHVEAAAQDADPAGAMAVAAALPATNQAASAIIANGTITKPGKAASPAISNESSRSEGRSSRASALADAGDVIRRGFASEVAAHTDVPPIQGKADDSSNTPSNGAQPPQHSAANPASIATPAQQPDPPPVQQAASAPTAAAPHAPAQQPDPGVSIATINTGASPTQTPAAATPAHLAAQIQVSQHAPDVNALAVNIAAKSEDGQKHFDIRLDPAELGRVDVRLTVDDAGKAQAVLSVEKPQTLELLQKDQAHLERALKDAGLDLAQNGLSFSLKGQQQQAMHDHAPFARGQRLAASAVASVDDIIPTLSPSGIAASDTRLDIRV